MEEVPLKSLFKTSDGRIFEKGILTPEGPPIDRAVVRRAGSDVTLIAYGGMVATALEAAEAAVEEDWDVEVIDLRSLSPFDDQTLTESVPAPAVPSSCTRRRASPATAPRSPRG